MIPSLVLLAKMDVLFICGDSGCACLWRETVNCRDAV